MLSACVNDSGSEYIGHWVNLEDARSTIDVVKNGENYILTIVEISKASKKPYKNPPISAVLEKGILVAGGGVLSFNIDNSSGNLITPVGSFKK
jgi:hypothetical protein